MITKVELIEDGFNYTDARGNQHSASYRMFLIRNAWNRGCNLEDLADGFGKGLGTMNGDWSGIRDSSDEAVRKMLERALNYMELE